MGSQSGRASSQRSRVAVLVVAVAALASLLATGSRAAAASQASGMPHGERTHFFVNGEPKPAIPAECPSTAPADAAAVLGETTQIEPDPSSVRLCGYARGRPLNLKGGSRQGVVLGPGPASVVAALIAQAPPATSDERRCANEPPDVLLRFAYPGGSSVDVGLVDFDCPPRTALALGRGTVFDRHQARSIDAGLASTLAADASVYGIPRPPATPDLFGDDVAEASEKAHKSGFVAEFGGEEVYADFAPERVLLQFPPAGMGDIGNEVALTLSVPQSRPCTATDVALVYNGFQGVTGNLVGSISIWDVSHRYCRLAGPLQLAGTGPSGRAVTKAVTYSVGPGIVLSPVADPQRPGTLLPVSELVAGLSFATPTAANCQASAVITPNEWSLSIAGGAATVANTGGLHGAFTVGCNGRIGAFGPVGLI